MHRIEGRRQVEVHPREKTGVAGSAVAGGLIGGLGLASHDNVDDWETLRLTSVSISTATMLAGAVYMTFAHVEARGTAERMRSDLGPGGCDNGHHYECELIDFELLVADQTLGLALGLYGVSALGIGTTIWLYSDSVESPVESTGDDQISIQVVPGPGSLAVQGVF